MKDLIVGLVLVVTTAIFTWAITYNLIVPGTLADKRIEQAAMAYADFGSAFVRLVGVQSAAGAAQSALVRLSQQANGNNAEEAAWTEEQYRRLRVESIVAEIEYFSAKARISVYGDSATIEFVKGIGGRLDEANKEKLIKALKAMRAHLGADEVSEKHLEEMLFGNGGEPDRTDRK